MCAYHVVCATTTYSAVAGDGASSREVVPAAWTCASGAVACVSARGACAQKHIISNDRVSLDQTRERALGGRHGGYAQG